MAPRPLEGQESLKRRLRATKSARRSRQIADIEAFVADRLSQFDAKLPSLELLSERDLDFLTAAVENC